MSLAAVCGACGKSYMVPDQYAGRAVKCKACGGSIDVPEPDVEVEAVADAPPLPRTVYVPPPPPTQAPADPEPPPKPAPAPLPWYFGFCRFCSGVTIFAAVLWVFAAFARLASSGAETVPLPEIVPVLGTSLGMIFSAGLALAVLDGMAALIRRTDSRA